MQKLLKWEKELKFLLTIFFNNQWMSTQKKDFFNKNVINDEA